MSFLKKVGGFIKDVAQSSIYPVVNAVNSVTGHEWKPDYETKLGEIVGNFGTVYVADISELAAKTVANGVSGGLASTATNSFRPEEKREGSGVALLPNLVSSKTKTEPVINNMLDLNGTIKNGLGTSFPADSSLIQKTEENQNNSGLSIVTGLFVAAIATVVYLIFKK